MHQLILLRHAKATPAAAGAADHERPLSADGRRAAGAIGQAMRQAGLGTDVVLVSSAVRTQQTLEALELAKLWPERPNIDTVPNLYMATRQQIQDLLRSLPETVRSALVIGHNPGLQDLAQSLAGSALAGSALAGSALAGGETQSPRQIRLAQDYPTAGLTEFLITTPWRKLGPGAAALQRFLSPADLA